MLRCKVGFFWDCLRRWRGVIEMAEFRFLRLRGQWSGCRGDTVADRGGNTLEGYTDSRSENGSSQGQNLAFTGLFVLTSLGGGLGFRRCGLG